MISGLCPYSSYPFQSIAIHSLWTPLKFSPASLIPILHLYDILIYLLLFLSSAMCCLYLLRVSWLEDFVENQLISWTWYLVHTVVFQWNQKHYLAWENIYYPQYCFLDLSGQVHRHPIWMSSRFRNLPVSCPVHIHVLKSTHLLSEVSKNTACTSHMRHVLARNNQCFHSAWLSALWSPRHSLYPHSAATQGNIHLLLVLAQVSSKRFPKSGHGRTSWVSATDIWSHSTVAIH